MWEGVAQASSGARPPAKQEAAPLKDEPNAASAKEGQAAPVPAQLLTVDVKPSNPEASKSKGSASVGPATPAQARDATVRVSPEPSLEPPDRKVRTCCVSFLLLHNVVHSSRACPNPSWAGIREERGVFLQLIRLIYQTNVMLRALMKSARQISRGGRG